MAADITLYGNRESGHSYKVRLALVLGQIAHSYVPIDIFVPHTDRPEPFRSLARFGEVPLLTHQGQAYAQSDAILCWLAEHTGRLGGESPERMARVREWLFWEANRIGLCLPHLRYARRFAPDDYPAGALDWLQQRFERDIAVLDAALAQGHAFILDDTPCVADFALCGYLFWADQASLAVPPHVGAWLERIRNLPHWKAPYELLA